jgi:hypothetical protein
VVQQSLEGLELEPPLRCRSNRIFVVASGERPSHRALCDRLTAAGAPCTLKTVDETPGESEPFLLSTRAQQTIAGLLSGQLQ